MRTTSIAPAGEPVVRRNKAPLLASADESCRRVYAYDSDDALSAYIYNIWMAVLTVLPSVERHGTGFFAFIYAYDATRLPATSWGLYSLAGQSRNSPSTFLYACGGSQNPDNYAVNSGASCDSTDYDACRYTTSTSDVLVTLTYDRPSPRCNYAETGLYYYGLRYYSTEAGRWCSRDPIQETLLYIARANRTATEHNAALRFANIFLVLSKKSILRDMYQFCRNNPVSMMDGFGFSYVGPTWCVPIGSYDEWEPTGEAQHSDWVQLRVDVLPWLPEVIGFFDYYYMAWWQQQRKVHVEETLCRSLCGESTIERDSVPTGETKTHWWTTWIITPTGVDPNGPCDDSRFCML